MLVYKSNNFKILDLLETSFKVENWKNKMNDNLLADVGNNIDVIQENK